MEAKCRKQTRQRVLLLREDITGVDTARVGHRRTLCKHYVADYGKTRQASTPRGSDADLDYKNTEVEVFKSLVAVDIILFVDIMDFGVDIVILGVDISVLVLNALVSSGGGRVLVSSA